MVPLLCTCLFEVRPKLEAARILAAFSPRAPQLLGAQSGSFAILAAIRRGSSRVSSCIADCEPTLIQINILEQKRDNARGLPQADFYGLAAYINRAIRPRS